MDIGAHFARLEAELRRKEAQAQSDQSSGSVGGSDQDQATEIIRFVRLLENKCLSGDFGDKKSQDKITQQTETRG